MIRISFICGLTATTYLQYPDPNQSVESRGKTENPTLQKGLGAFTSSLNYIGGTIGSALEVCHCKSMF